jgi:hypothetical protein
MLVKRRLHKHRRIVPPSRSNHAKSYRPASSAAATNQQLTTQPTQPPQPPSTRPRPRIYAIPRLTIHVALPTLHPTTTMPPKQIYGKGRTLNEPNFAQSTIQAFTSQENRSVVTAVGMFAVSKSSLRWVV